VSGKVARKERILLIAKLIGNLSIVVISHVRILALVKGRGGAVLRLTVWERRGVKIVRTHFIAIIVLLVEVRLVIVVGSEVSIEGAWILAIEIITIRVKLSVRAAKLVSSFEVVIILLILAWTRKL